MVSAMNTPARAFRLPPELYAQAKAIATQRGETVTHVITEALRRYVRRHEGQR